MWTEEVIRIEFLKFKVGFFYKVGSMVSVQDMLPNPDNPESEMKISLALTFEPKRARYSILVTR